MNLNDIKYSKFGLVRDMIATARVIESFDTDQAIETAHEIAQAGKLMLSGEGSSRLFPAKHAMRMAGEKGWKLSLQTEAARQLLEYDLTDWAVFAASNSGKTSETIKLFQKLADAGHQKRYGLVANADTKLQALSHKGYVLSCGPEGAVAATKSVVAQGLFYQALLEHAAGQPTLRSQLPALAQAVQHALTVAIDPQIVQRIRSAGTIYFSGRNDGVAEELALKTNEIARRKSDYMESTYAVHGVEEVMDAKDVVIVIDPYPDYQSKFTDVLVKGVGASVIAISDKPTDFPTIRIPSSPLPGYVQLAAGWNLLVEVGIGLGIDLDKPVRARKVGNEFVS